MLHTVGLLQCYQVQPLRSSDLLCPLALLLLTFWLRSRRTHTVRDVNFGTDSNVDSHHHNEDLSHHM